LLILPWDFGDAKQAFFQRVPHGLYLFRRYYVATPALYAQTEVRSATGQENAAIPIMPDLSYGDLRDNIDGCS
jgi:hypothetical protein